MEQSRKYLKTSAIVVLALAILSLIDILYELFFGELGMAFKSAEVTEQFTNDIILTTQIFIVVVSFLLLLPQIYIGLKGIKVANNPDYSRGHIVWGTILLVLTAIGLISPVLALFRGAMSFANIANICSQLVDVFILYEYVKYAKAVRNSI